jgi:GTP-binding protein
MTFRINDGPLAGKEGDKVQSRVIRDRLMKEAEGNVALKVRDLDGEAFEVAGRGELQLSILIETMRREGFELTVGRPRVVMQQDAETGQRLEPVEEVIIDVDEEFSGAVVQKLSERKAELKDMRPSGAGRQRLMFHAPTRGLIGYQGELMTDTRGTAIMNRLFHAYAHIWARSRRVIPACFCPTRKVMQWPMRCGSWKIAGQCSSSRATRFMPA